MFLLPVPWIITNEILLCRQLNNEEIGDKASIVGLITALSMNLHKTLLLRNKVKGWKPELNALL